MASSALRRERLRSIRQLKQAGLSSTEIGRELGLAPSTVRDYLNDPTRSKARIRQRARLFVLGGPTLGGTQVTDVSRKWRRGGPAKGASPTAAEKRGRQLRAIVGYYR